MTQTLIAQGAEAVIYLIGPPQKIKPFPKKSSSLIPSNSEANFIIKDRTKKSYRIPELDNRIRQRRTRSEAKLLLKASKIINCPAPFFQPSIKETTKIKMPFIDGKKLSEHLDNFPLTKQKQILKQIGQEVAKLHDNEILHGDLTTSNMILVKDPTTKTKTQPTTRNHSVNSCASAPTGGGAGRTSILSGAKLFFIDFGLGFISQRYEDKAVDLHLLKQALEAKHFKHWEILFDEVIKEYKNSKEADKVLKQFEKVEKRGRYKG